MIVSVKTARYLEKYRLNIVFDTGESGDVDLEDLIFKYDVALPLRNEEYFKSFHLDSWATIVWDCGFDVAPETLYERAMTNNLSKKIKNEI